MGFDHDFARREPIFLLTAIEHHLQRADRETERAEAEPIELLARVARRLRQKGNHSQQGNDADRQIDIEDPPPTVIFRQPAAENRAENRPDHDAHAEERHGETLALARIGVEQHRL